MEVDFSALPHDSRGYVVILAGAVTTTLAFVTVCARLYTRHFIINQVGVDDWLAIASMLSTIATNVSQSLNANRYLGRHMYDLDIAVDFPEFLKLFWINELLYNVAMLFVKMTFLVQYYRVFRQIQKMRLTYIIAMVLVGGWCLGQILAITFICIPVSGVWRPELNAKCQDQQVGVYINAIGVLVTDIVVLLIPIPALWKLKLPRTQKFALLGIFSIGGFTSAISIVRLTTLEGKSDFTYDSVTSACWSIAELSSGIIAAALATIRPLISRYIPALASKASRYSPGDYQKYGDSRPTVRSAAKRQSTYRKSNPLRLPGGGVGGGVGGGGGGGGSSDSDLFYGGDFELRENLADKRDLEAQTNPDSIRLSLSLDSEKSDSFNVAFSEDRTAAGAAAVMPTSPQRTLSSSASMRPLRPGMPAKRGSRDSETGLWSGVQTRVTGGSGRGPAARTSSSAEEEGRRGGHDGMGIRVDRDWVVQETSIRR
ncbi:hypothetical protein F4778DRAFT_387642 [Xylariomycetidae sp. FL2044]|nr:hypothetical protein F4778DRAFT_387642 [Xylariomycetidae sp. FL2044]